MGPSVWKLCHFVVGCEGVKASGEGDDNVDMRCGNIWESALEN